MAGRQTASIAEAMRERRSIKQAAPATARPM
jgi:hypothetical protein